MKTYIIIMTIVYITLEIAAFIKLKIWNIKWNVRKITFMGTVIETLILYILVLIPILNVLVIVATIELLFIPKAILIDNQRELLIKEMEK